MKKIVSTLVGLGIGLSMLSAMNAGGADMGKAETDINWDGSSSISGWTWDGKNYRMVDESIYDAPQTAPVTPATLPSSSTQVVATEPAGEFVSWTETACETAPIMPGQGTGLPQQEITSATTTETSTTTSTSTSTTETTTTETSTAETTTEVTTASSSPNSSISFTVTKDNQTAGCEISSSNLDNQSFAKIVINTIVGAISKIFS